MASSEAVIHNRRAAAAERRRRAIDSKNERKRRELMNMRNLTEMTKDALRDVLREHKFVDVGRGTELVLGVSLSTLNKAVRQLFDNEEVNIYFLPVKIEGTDKSTSMKVIVPLGNSYVDVVENQDKIYSMKSVGEKRTSERHQKMVQDLIDSSHHQADLLEKAGLTEAANLIRPEAKSRAQIRMEAAQERGRKMQDRVNRVHVLKRNGYSNVAIGEALGTSESTVRADLKREPYWPYVLESYLQESLENARNEIISDMLSSEVADDVFGEPKVKGQRILNVTDTKREVAVLESIKYVRVALEFTVEIKED